MKYRQCIITPSRIGHGYDWEHPNRMDYDPETGAVWQGFGQSIEECVIQIDQWYDL